MSDAEEPPTNAPPPPPPPPAQQGDTTTTTKGRAEFGKETAEESGGRERWNSRIGFYLAAVGSAVGFGNVWR